MTLLNEQNVKNHIATASQTTFTYDFRVDAEEDMQVWVNGSEVTTGWSITGLGDDEGGSVIFDTGRTVGDAVTLLRQVEYTQETEYIAYDPFPAAAHEAALDKLTMQTQQLAEIAGRGITAPPGSSGVDYTMPEYEAGKALKWSEEDPKEIVNSDYDPDSQASAAAASAAAAVVSAAAAASSETDAESAKDDAETAQAAAEVAQAAAEAAVPTISTSEPSGGSDGDVWYQYEA
jgi:hypothetical protein